MNDEATITREQLAQALTKWERYARAGNWQPAPEATPEEIGQLNADMLWPMLKESLPA